MDHNSVGFGSLNSINLNFEQKKTRFSLKVIRKHIALVMTVIVVLALLVLINIFVIIHAPTTKAHTDDAVLHTTPGIPMSTKIHLTYLPFSYTATDSKSNIVECRRYKFTGSRST